MRKTRCNEIVQYVEEKEPNLKPLIKDYKALAEKLISLANVNYTEKKLVSNLRESFCLI
jgi:hypothetical protein